MDASLPIGSGKTSPSDLETSPHRRRDYTWVLDDPAEVGVPAVTAPPLPRLTEPAAQPLVDVACAEALVGVCHRRVRTVATYWHARWPSAVAQTLVRAGVVERLGAAAEELPEPFGLVVLDAWRPLALQSEIFEAAYTKGSLPAGFVSPPSGDPGVPPPHCTGGALDVSLTWGGRALRLGTDFDDFTDRARTDALEAHPSPERDLRRLLVSVMRAHGFVVLDCEWWHFEFGTRRWAALKGRPVRYGLAEPAACCGAGAQ